LLPESFRDNPLPETYPFPVPVAGTRTEEHVLTLSSILRTTKQMTSLGEFPPGMRMVPDRRPADGPGAMAPTVAADAEEGTYA
jgi:hypothetical protein